MFLQLFKEQSKEIRKEWTSFIHRLDLEWREALRRAIRSSLVVRPKLSSITNSWKEG